MMLQATELGLGSVWIGYFKPDVLRREFDLPAGPERRSQTRIPVDELVSCE